MPVKKPRGRCDWALANPRLRAYHDREWGVPLHDDRRLFEFLVLDAFQAGLSWAIILDKREDFRRALAGFDPQRLARFDRRRIERLLQDRRLVRNRLKMEATVNNARAFLEVQQQFGSFDSYIWRFVDGRPRQNRFRLSSQVPAQSQESRAMSRDLRARGFSFVGPVICYAFMQAAGLVNDHLLGCFRHRQVARLARTALPATARDSTLCDF